VPHPSRSLRRVGSDAADTTSCPFRTNRVAYAFEVPALRRLREGRGTHLYWSCRQDQKPGPPGPANCSERCMNVAFWIFIIGMTSTETLRRITHCGSSVKNRRLMELDVVHPVPGGLASLTLKKPKPRESLGALFTGTPSAKQFYDRPDIGFVNLCPQNSVTSRRNCERTRGPSTAWNDSQIANRSTSLRMTSELVSPALHP
jgi:hypothetical protein